VVEVYGLNERGREAAERAQVAQHGEEIRIDVDRRSFFLGIGSSPEVRITVRAPHGTSVEATTAAADVRGVGRFGELDVKSAAGDLSFDDVERDANINNVSGEIRVRRIGGTATVKSVSGDVALGELGGSVTVNSVSGDVALEALAPGKATVKTVSGDVKAGVPRGLALWIDANSVSGKSTSDLDVGDAPPTEGTPLVELRVKSVSGDIRVVRASPVSV
jgi:hypothetical protein